VSKLTDNQHISNSPMTSFFPDCQKETFYNTPTNKNQEKIQNTINTSRQAQQQPPPPLPPTNNMTLVKMLNYE
jgi:hypothetical protein